MTPVCGVVAFCSRNKFHRGHCGGFRPLPVEPVEAPAEPLRLTRKEREVLIRFGRGESWDNICSDMKISRSTLAQHRTRLMEKANANTIPEILIRFGWLRLPEIAA